MSTAGKEVDDPAVIAKQEKKRIQVQIRHNGHRIFFGTYYCECKANFARDFSKFLKSDCQNKSLEGRYRHDCSLEIFREFKCSNEPLARKCKKLPKYNKEDEDVKRVYEKIHVDARNRIKEMLPRFIERVSTEKLGLLKSRNECCVTGSRNFASVSEAKEFLKVNYNDWVILADGVKDNGAECIRRRCLAHYSAQSQVLDISLANAKPCRTNPTDWAPISSEPMPDTMSLRESMPDTMYLRELLREPMPDTMSLREPMPDMMSLLEARRYLDEHFRNEHWLILAECMKFCGLDTVALLQDSSLDQEC